VAIIIRKCNKHTISIISTRIISYETKDFAFINTYRYSNFESHKTEVAEHFQLLKEETICLLAINKQIIVGISISLLTSTMVCGQEIEPETSAPTFKTISPPSTLKSSKPKNSPFHRSIQQRLQQF
jgi:hypothetical protein